MKTSILRRMVLLLAAACLMTGAFVRPAEARVRFLDKTRFVADVGIAYYVFHHWVSAPYKAGAFQSGAPHRTGSIVKAGIALLFAVHEVKSASKIAHNSKDPLLQKLAGGIDSMGGTFASIGSKFKSGHFAPSDLNSLGSSYSAFNNSALANGLQIKDKVIPVPGL